MSNYRNLTTLAAAFKALSNPHRLALFQRMTGCCEPGTTCAVDSTDTCWTVGELGQGVDIAPSTLSHHLKELAQAGLIVTRREGKQVLCRVDPQVLRDLAGFFAGPLSPTGSACRPTPKDD